jgi:hypothetical protein
MHEQFAVLEVNIQFPRYFPCPALFTHRCSLAISAFLKKTRVNHISLPFLEQTVSP